MGAGTVALTLVLPPVTMVGIFIVLLPILLIASNGVDESARYAVLPRKDGSCIGYAQSRRDGDLSIQFSRRGSGEPLRVEMPKASAPPLRDAKSFIGERVRRPSGEIAVITAVSGNAVSHNVAVFDPKSPSGTDALQGLCIAP
jgi:hypothetical protein